MINRWTLLSCLIITTNSCQVKSSKQEEPTKQQEQLFNWGASEYLNIDVVRGSSIDQNNTIHIYGDDVRLRSFNNGDDFHQILAIDSVSITNIVLLDNIFYSKGEFHQNHSQYGLPDSSHSWLFQNTNSLFSSKDGNEWSRIIGPFSFRTFSMQNDSLFHFSIENGVRTYNLNTHKSRDVEFFDSKGFDLANSLLPFADGTLLAGSHDGIHKSTDYGKTWVKVSAGYIDKDEDYVDKLIAFNEETVISVGNKTFISTDKGESWTEMIISIPDGEEQQIISGIYDAHLYEDSTLYSLSYYGLTVTNINNPSESISVINYPDNFDSISRYDLLIALKNGDVLLINEDLKYIQKGTRK